MKTLLFDGWPLAYAPASPAALHLAAQIATLPAELQAELALPAAEESIAWLPEAVRHVTPTPNTAWGQLAWSQKTLPRLAAKIGAHSLATNGITAPLFGGAEVYASPAGWSLGAITAEYSHAHHPAGIAERLAASLGWGGLSRAQAVYWPQDLPLPAVKLPWRSVPPLVHPWFQAGSAPPPISDTTLLALPETYILYHGPLEQPALEALSACWSWAAGPLGAYYPLLIYGVEQPAQAAIIRLFQQAGLADSIRLLSPAAPADLARLYHGCSALLQPAPPSPWGCPLRHALACAKPVVATAGRWCEALVGPAGYLAPADAPRQLGAALISVVVEPELSERISAAAQVRAEGWVYKNYWQAVLEKPRSAQA